MSSCGVGVYGVCASLPGTRCASGVRAGVDISGTAAVNDGEGGIVDVGAVVGADGVSASLRLPGTRCASGVRTGVDFSGTAADKDGEGGIVDA